MTIETKLEITPKVQNKKKNIKRNNNGTTKNKRDRRNTVVSTF